MKNENIIEKVTYEIIHKMEETRDDFIFTTISRYMERDYELSNIPMSKQILCRALECFRQEHTEEYYRLLDECNKRMQLKESK